MIKFSNDRTMPKPPDEFIKELMSGRELFHNGRATRLFVDLD